MIRLALWLLGALATAAMVHLVAILVLPPFVPDPVAARLTRIGPELRFHLLRWDQADGIRWLDPAFAQAVCRFSLATAPVRIRPRLPDTYWSLSLHEPNLASVYDVSDRSVGERPLDLLIAHADQVVALRESPPTDLRDPVVVTWTGGDEGFALIRAFVPSASERPEIEAALTDARCELIGR